MEFNIILFFREWIRRWRAQLLSCVSGYCRWCWCCEKKKLRTKIPIHGNFWISFCHKRDWMQRSSFFTIAIIKNFSRFFFGRECIIYRLLLVKLNNCWRLCGKREQFLHSRSSKSIELHLEKQGNECPPPHCIALPCVFMNGRWQYVGGRHSNPFSRFATFSAITM